MDSYGTECKKDPWLGLYAKDAVNKRFLPSYVGP